MVSGGENRVVTPEEIEEEAMHRDEKADSISQYLEKQKRVKKKLQD